MAKIKEEYLRCDCCCKKIEKGKFSWENFYRGFVFKWENGNRIDLCNDCFAKIKNIKHGITTRDNIYDCLINCHKEYENESEEAAYWIGVEQVLDIAFPKL